MDATGQFDISGARKQAQTDISTGVRPTRSPNGLLRRLLRTTSSGQFIPEIDGLRFIAISAVILHHVTASYLETTERLGRVQLPAQWWDVFPRSLTIAVGYAGHFGVHLFFVISGFILALPFATSFRQGGSGPILKWYYLRRVVRLEPPYVLNMSLCMLLIFFSKPDWNMYLGHYLASVLYLHGSIFGTSSWLNGVAWSLEIEVQFYLILPVLALVLRVRNTGLRRLLLLVAIILPAWLAQRFIHSDSWASLSLLNYLHFFFAGFLLADLHQQYSAREFRRRFIWDAVAALAGMFIFIILSRRYDLYWLTAALVAILYTGLFLGRLGSACIRWKPAVVIGGMCYTIYLYHFMVINWLAPWTMRLASPAHSILFDMLLQSLLLVPPVLFASVLLFVLVEQPCMRLSARLSKRLRGGAKSRCADQSAR